MGEKASQIRHVLLPERNQLNNSNQADYIHMYIRNVNKIRKIFADSSKKYQPFILRQGKVMGSQGNS